MIKALRDPALPLSMIAFGGGSATGASNYPDYIRDTQDNWLKGNALGDQTDDSMVVSMVDLMNAAHVTSPYDNETAFDPNAALTLVSTSPLSNMDARFTTTQTLIDALDASSDWTSYVAQAASSFTHFSDIDFISNLSTAIEGLLSSVEDALSSTSITNMVNAYENEKRTRFQRDQGLWSAGMADINAVHTSSFIIGLALQQSEFANSVDKYEADLKGSIYTQIIQAGIDSHMKANILRIGNKDQMLLSAPQVMGQLNNLKAELSSRLVTLKADLEKLNIIALKEQSEANLAIDVDAATWDFEVYQYGANLLASAAGGVIQKGNKTSRGQSAMSGALAGAAIGAYAGPVGSLTGVAIGAGAGAILGWATGG